MATAARPDIMEQVRAKSRVADPSIGGASEGWRPLVELGPSPERLPPFPTHALPSWVRAMVENVAGALGVDPTMPAALALPVLSSVCARRAVIAAKGDGSWVEPLILRVCVLAETGERKSPTFNAMAAPIEDLDRESRKKDAANVARAAEKRRIEEARLSSLRAQAVKAKGDERMKLENDALDLAAHLEANPIPKPRQLLTEDATPQAIVRVLDEQGGVVSLLTDEGGVFGTICGRYSGGAPDLDVWLKSYGSAALRIDRADGRSIFIPSPSMPIGIATQPAIIADLSGRHNEVVLRSGLLERFLWARPQSTMAGAKLGDQGRLDEAIERAYALNLSVMDQLPRDRHAADRHQRRTLHLSRGAYTLFEGAYNAIQERMADGGDLADFRDYTNKLRGRAVRIAGVLHLAAHAGEEQPWQVEVSRETMANALEIMHWSIPHARHALALTETPEDGYEDELRALKAIARDGRTILSHSQIGRLARKGAHWTGRHTTTLIQSLIKHGYLRYEVKMTVKRRGRPTKFYGVNPEWDREKWR